MSSRHGMGKSAVTLALLVMMGALAGCELPSTNPTSNGVELKDSGDLKIDAGSIGPARVGMTKREALGTGLFKRQKFDPADKCKASALKWKKQYKNVRVRTDTAGTIRSMTVAMTWPTFEDRMRDP